MVLIVEDEKLLARTLSKAIREAGYKAVTVGSAEQAEKQLSSADFGLLVVDNRLPKQSGLELISLVRDSSIRNSSVRSSNENLKVILMTAFDGRDVKSEAKRLRVDRYMKKPFDLEKMLAHVTELIGGPEEEPAG